VAAKRLLRHRAGSSTRPTTIAGAASTHGPTFGASNLFMFMALKPVNLIPSSPRGDLMQPATARMLEHPAALTSGALAGPLAVPSGAERCSRTESGCLDLRRGVERSDVIAYRLHVRTDESSV
jgi:hypothetical protein